MSPFAATPPPPAPSGKIVGAYTKQDHVTGLYNRVVPANFSGREDDQLMKNLITNYALEGKTDGAPNGHFYITKESIQTEARNVVDEHFGWTGEKTNNYV